MTAKCLGEWSCTVQDALACDDFDICVMSALATPEGCIGITQEHDPNACACFNDCQECDFTERCFEKDRRGCIGITEEHDPKACFGHGPCSILKNHKCEWASVCNDYLDEQSQAVVKGTIAIREEA